MKKLFITFGEGCKNIVNASKTDIDSVNFNIESYFETDLIKISKNGFEVFENANVWFGVELCERLKRKYFNKLTKDYTEIILVAQMLNPIEEGVVYNLSRYLKTRGKKVTFITNKNCVNEYLLMALNKYASVIDVYSDEEYQQYYKKYVPKVSVLELDGLLNTVYLKNIKKYA